MTFRMAPTAWALALLAAALAGCSSASGSDPAPPKPAPDTPAVDGTPLTETFAGPGLGAWRKESGNWGQTAQDGGVAMVRVADETVFLLAPAGNHGAFEASVRFKADGAKAGIVYHWVDADNHQYVVGSAFGWDYYTMHRGKHDVVEPAPVEGATPAPTGQWTDLTVRFEGGKVTASSAGQTVVEYPLPPAHVQAGHVGLVLRGTGYAAFDDFSVRPL